MEDRIMSLSKFQNRLLSPFDRMFEGDWFNWSNNHYSDTGTTLPSVNILENGEAFEVEVAAPGYSKEDFKVTLDNGLLTVASEKEMENETRDGGRHTRREFSYRSFSRAFTLPNSADGEKIEARYENGILRIRIPKKEEARPKPAKTISIG